MIVVSPNIVDVIRVVQESSLDVVVEECRSMHWWTHDRVGTWLGGLGDKDGKRLGWVVVG